MKTKNLVIACVWVAMASLVWSCSEDEPTDVVPQVSSESFMVDNILLGSNSALSRARSTGFGGPMGAIYGGFAERQGARVTMKPSELFRSMTQGVANDSIDDEEPHCLVETWTEDGTGNYTYTIDFGDGCYYYDYWMFGKMEEKGFYSDNSFSSNVTYYNFGGSHDEGGEDWVIDGTHSYSGTWEETEETDEDSVWSYNASYEFAADLTEKYVEYGHWGDSSEVSTGEQTIIVDYVANGSEEMDNLGYTVKTRSEDVSVSTGESYTSLVEVPLYYDYACEIEEVWIFVSGRESGSYAYEGTTGTYSIDYGDGACDNIITITENGVTEEIDLDDVWDEWEEECGTEEGRD